MHWQIVLLCCIFSLEAVEGTEYSQAVTISIPINTTYLKKLSLFAGGLYNDMITALVDIFDYDSTAWSLSSLSSSRAYHAGASVGSVALFGGGETDGGRYTTMVDIYDGMSRTWNGTNMGVARAYLAATSVRDLVFFVGGTTQSGTVLSTVEIYNVSAGKWIKWNLSLSVPRWRLAATSGDTYAIFAGGQLSSSPTDVSSTVDIFNLTSRSLQKTTFSTARCCMAALTMYSKSLFAGGLGAQGPLDIVEIYDFTLGTWSTARLASPRAFLAITAVENYALIVGGKVSMFLPGSYAVDVYDVTNAKFVNTSLNLTIQSAFLTAASNGTYAIFSMGKNWTRNMNFGIAISQIPQPTANFPTAAPLLLPQPAPVDPPVTVPQPVPVDPPVTVPQPVPVDPPVIPPQPSPVILIPTTNCIRRLNDHTCLNSQNSTIIPSNGIYIVESGSLLNVTIVMVNSTLIVPSMVIIEFCTVYVTAGNIMTNSNITFINSTLYFTGNFSQFFNTSGCIFLRNTSIVLSAVPVGVYPFFSLDCYSLDNVQIVTDRCLVASVKKLEIEVHSICSDEFPLARIMIVVFCLLLILISGPLILFCTSRNTSRALKKIEVRHFPERTF